MDELSHTPSPHGIMFHHFHDGRHPPSQGSISSLQLENMLEAMGRDRILSAEEWMARFRHTSLKSNDVCLTFDDGLRCQYDIALPVLRKFNITAFWFVYSCIFEGQGDELETYRYFRNNYFQSLNDFYELFFHTLDSSKDSADINDHLREFSSEDYLSECTFYSPEDRKFRFIRDEILTPNQYRALMHQLMRKLGADPKDFRQELWMSRDNVKELSMSGHVIGLHSHTHPTRIARLPAREQREEYARNLVHIRSITGCPTSVMSHPCNSYSAETLKILRELGLTVGFRANMSFVANRSSLEFPRDDHSNITGRLGLRS